MHKFTKVYLDMDGVICDFEKKFKEMFNVSPASAESRHRFGDLFHKFYNAGAFAELDKMPDADELLNYLKTIEVPIEILSSTARPSSNVTISRQKQIWLDKNGITYPAIFVPGASLKAQYADENSILIDDTEGVIDAWNKAGGTGILHKDALTTISILSTLLSV